MAHLPPLIGRCRGGLAASGSAPAGVSQRHIPAMPKSDFTAQYEGRWREGAVEEIEERVGDKAGTRTIWRVISYDSEPQEGMHAVALVRGRTPAC